MATRCYLAKRIYPERNREYEGNRPGRFYFFSPASLFFVLPLTGTVSARWHVARGALLPECRRRCIFCGDWDGQHSRARARRLCERLWRHARARTHARITQVCSVIATTAVDDLLVITRPHRTQLCLPTPQSISQGTRRTRNPPTPPPPPILRAADGFVIPKINITKKKILNNYRRST